jgi:hypothetical protein
MAQTREVLGDPEEISKGKEVTTLDAQTGNRRVPKFVLRRVVPWPTNGKMMDLRKMGWTNLQKIQVISPSVIVVKLLVISLETVEG